MPRPPVKLEKKKIRLSRVRMMRSYDDKAVYEKKLKSLQLRMLRIQQAYYHQGLRALIVFEGWDAAGKGGAIRRVTERLDPRGVQVHAIAAPTKEEQSKHYLYRFWQRLPHAGKIAIFDRSWYGRVLVEKVEGFASEAAVARAYDEINDMERLLLDDGVRVVKVFLHITADEQLNRFAERLENPYKRWKLTDEDVRNRARFKDYENAIERMFERTSTKRAPWHVIGADWKWQTRIRVLEILTDALSKDVDLTLPIVPAAALEEMRAKLGLRAPKKSTEMKRETKKSGKRDERAAEAEKLDDKDASRKVRDLKKAKKAKKDDEKAQRRQEGAAAEAHAAKKNAAKKNAAKKNAAKKNAAKKNAAKKR
jgi:PPK2 family polyphosphate:nucleotide phosphotransferase